eukprot:3560168-Alexandrium_andersonii.AAC.1
MNRCATQGRSAPSPSSWRPKRGSASWTAAKSSSAAVAPSSLSTGATRLTCTKSQRVVAHTRQ